MSLVWRAFRKAGPANLVCRLVGHRFRSPWQRSVVSGVLWCLCVRCHRLVHL